MTSSTTALRAQALTLYQKGLARITPEYLLRQALQYQPAAGQLELRFMEADLSERRTTIPFPPAQSIVLVAVGKAAQPMAEEAERILQNRIEAGIIVTKHGFGSAEAPFPVYQSSHPVPAADGVSAANAVADLLKNLSPQQILLALISGGASALLPAPPHSIPLSAKQELVSLMLRTDMDIHQMNRVRKAISRLKGGGMAALAAPAQTIGLYLSDVPGDALSSIGSGPTVPEETAHPEVIALLKDCGIWEQTPPVIQAFLQGEALPKTSTLPPLNGIIGCNRHLLQAMNREAQQAGFLTQVVDTPTTGRNAEAVPLLLQRWANLRSYHPDAKKCCLISGGETTVAVTGSGRGGRCQELAALIMPHLAPGDVFLAAGSDGNDGPTDAAGGVVDAQAWQQFADRKAYQALLANHDSYALLERCGCLIKVPPTRNNVMDVHCFLSAAD